MSNEMFDEVNDLIANNNYKLIADKILTTLKGVQDSPQISQKRWIWELMQNARDVANPKFNHKVSIQIHFYDKKLIFKHNGKCFLIKDILGLLQQVSSKDSRNSEGQTGKFGTGFIGTHLLSTIIDVEGVLFDGKKYRNFHIELDRSKNTSEELALDISKSINSFRKPEEFDKKFKIIENYDQKETDYETSFTYYFKKKNGDFDPDKFLAAKNGIDDLENTLPTTLITQNERIKEVQLIDQRDPNNIKISTYSLEMKVLKKIPANSSEISEGIVSKKEDKKEIHLLSYLEKEFRLLIQIENENIGIFKTLKLLKRKESEPVIYRNFPLIGSEKFYLPFILDGFNFNPLEPRNGLYLNGDYPDSKENRNIITKAIDSIFVFIDYILNEEKNSNFLVSNKYLLASSRIPEPPTKNYDQIAMDWIYNLQIEWRKKLIELPLLNNFEKPNESVNLKLLLLPVFEENCDPDFFKVVAGLNLTFININGKNTKRILPCEYVEWFNIIVKDNLNNDIKSVKIKDNKYYKSWGVTFIYDENDLFNDLEMCENVENIYKKKQNEKETPGTPGTVSLDDITQVINNLNILYSFLKKKNRIDYLEKRAIIPNQNLILRSLKDKNDNKKIILYSDSKKRIPKSVRNIYDQIVKEDSNKLSNILIDERINLEELGVEIPEKNFLQVTKEFNDYLNSQTTSYEDKFKFVYNLISIEPEYEHNDDNIDKIKKMYKISSELKIFDNFDLPEKTREKQNIDSGIGLWKEAIKFWLKEHPKQIEKFNNIENLKSKFKEKKDDKQVLEWLNEYYKFLRPLSNEFENLKMFPCQSKNGNFHYLKDLYSDTGFPEEFKDILENNFKYNIREELLPKEITLYKELDHNPMYESKVTDELANKFEKMESGPDKDDVVFKIISLKPKGGEKIGEYCEKITFFGKILFEKHYEIKEINTTQLKYILFFNYAFNIICNKISSYNNYENIKAIVEKCELKTKDNFCNFLSEIIICIWDGPKNGIPLNNILNDFDKKKIFLLQNDDFLPIDKVKMKLSYEILKDNIEIEEGILYNLSKNQPINIDYTNILLNKKLNEKLLNYSTNFGNNVLELKQVCQSIDSGIIEYDSKHYRYDKFFKDFVKTLREYLKKVTGLGCLFPFFNERQNIIFFNCLDKSEFDKIIELYTKHDMILSINGFDDIMEYMKKHGFKDFKALYESLTRPHGPCTVIVNGNFKFSGENNKNNNLTIKSNCFSKPLEIQAHNVNYNIDFEIVPKIANSNNNILENIEIEVIMKNLNLTPKK